MALPFALRLTRAAGLAAALALFAPAPALVAEPQGLNPDQARAFAFTLLVENRADEAAALAEVLIARDANDREAWLALAQARSLLGQQDKSLEAARRAWTLSDTSAQRYAASLVAARALQADGALTRAQFWLRRAADVAPNDPMKARAVGEFRRTRQANPLTTRLNFSVTPSSNINNGARSERVAGGTISGPSLALSGLAYEASLRLSYRLPSSGGPSSRLGFSLISKSYTLSDAAKVISPASKNSDFAFQEAELSHLSFWGKDGATALQLRAGSNWSGGANLSHFGGTTVTRYLRLGARRQLSFGGGVERIARQDNATRSSTNTRLFARWSNGFDNGNRLSLGASVSDAASSSAITDHSLAKIDARYSFADAPMNTQVDLTMALEYRNYHRDLVLFGRRQDTTASVGVDVTLKNREYYGFAPTVGLSARKTSSTVGLYDSDTVGLRIGLKSLF